MSSEVIERIARIHAAETDRDAPLSDGSRLPLSFEAITPAWLTAVLAPAGSGAQVLDLQLGPRDDGTSNRRALSLQWNPAGKALGLPEALFGKASHDLSSRIVVGISGAARCEQVFYRDVRPQLDIVAPVARYAEVDETSANSLILLDDLRRQGVVFCDQHTPISLERAQSQMTLLGTVHGQVYARGSLQQAIGSLTTWPEFFAGTVAMIGMREGAAAGFAEAVDVIPPRLYRQAARIWGVTEASVEDHRHLPHTLAHGDVHLRNWYIAADGAMGLGDWQCCGRGHWGRDVAYTLATALDIEDRRRWERDLLACYVDTLAAQGGPRVSVDQALQVYRRQLPAALAWWTYTLSPPPGMPDMQPRDATLTFIGRIATAMDDLDSLDAF